MGNKWSQASGGGVQLTDFIGGLVNKFSYETISNLDDFLHNNGEDIDRYLGTKVFTKASKSRNGYSIDAILDSVPGVREILTGRHNVGYASFKLVRHVHQPPQFVEFLNRVRPLLDIVDTDEQPTSANLWDTLEREVATFMKLELHDSSLTNKLANWVASRDRIRNGLNTLETYLRANAKPERQRPLEQAYVNVVRKALDNRTNIWNHQELPEEIVKKIAHMPAFPAHIWNPDNTPEELRRSTLTDKDKRTQEELAQRDFDDKLRESDLRQQKQKASAMVRRRPARRIKSTKSTTKRRRRR